MRRAVAEGGEVFCDGVMCGRCMAVRCIAKGGAACNASASAADVTRSDHSLKNIPCGPRVPSVKLGDEHTAAKVFSANPNHRVCLRTWRRRSLGNYWTAEHCAVRRGCGN